ncbi:MAG: hypothetical protein J0M30_11990 [Chitinophagales bacterium]|nr:hypothetical protein [Chitinophagales bacterium]
MHHNRYDQYRLIRGGSGQVIDLHSTMGQSVRELFDLGDSLGKSGVCFKHALHILMARAISLSMNQLYKQKGQHKASQLFHHCFKR